MDAVAPSELDYGLVWHRRHCNGLNACITTPSEFQSCWQILNGHDTLPGGVRLMYWQTIKVHLIAQATLVWMVTPTTRCVASPRPNAVAFTPVGRVHLMYWQTVKLHSIVQAILVWMVTPTTHCVASPRPNAVAFTPVGCVHLMY